MCSCRWCFKGLLHNSDLHSTSGATYMSKNCLMSIQCTSTSGIGIMSELSPEVGSFGFLTAFFLYIKARFLSGALTCSPAHTNVPVAQTSQVF